MTTTLGWSRCPNCEGRINLNHGPDCPRCGTPPLQPIEIVPEHPVGAGDPELGAGTPGPELAAAQIEIRNLEARIGEVESAAAEEMLEAQRVILEQQTEIADLRTQLTHALADAAYLPEPVPASSAEGSGI